MKIMIIAYLSHLMGLFVVKLKKKEKNKRQLGKSQTKVNNWPAISIDWIFNQEKTI